MKKQNQLNSLLLNVLKGHLNRTKVSLTLEAIYYGCNDLGTICVNAYVMHIEHRI